MTVILDVHDFNIVNPRLDLLLKLKAWFPYFKVSLFTIPLIEPSDYGPYLTRNKNLELIKSCSDWMEFIPHGLYHNSGREMLNYDDGQFEKVVIPLIDKSFNDMGLNYEKGFCSPHWRQSKEVTKTLNKIGWWSAVLREETNFPERYYQYNFLANEPFWESDLDVLKIHSHLYGTRNDLGKCMNNLLKLPKDTIFKYVTEFIEINGN